MSIYKVTFIYGSWHLWVDFEIPHIEEQDQRGFADLAQLAVDKALEFIPEVSSKDIAHDYIIWEMDEPSKGNYIAKMVYSFDTLVNE